MVTDLKDGLKEASSILHKDLSIDLPFHLYRIYLISQLVDDVNHNTQYYKNYRNKYLFMSSYWVEKIERWSCIS